MYFGGAFFGPKLPPKGNDDPSKVIRQNCLVWGKAARDATDSVHRKHHVHFLIRYGEEANPNVGKLDKYGHKEKALRGIFMQCDMRSDKLGASALAAIETGDMVFCLGRCTSQLRKTKKRGEMWFTTMKVDIILPLSLVDTMMTLLANPKIREMLDEVSNSGGYEFEE